MPNTYKTASELELRQEALIAQLEITEKELKILIEVLELERELTLLETN